MLEMINKLLVVINKTNGNLKFILFSLIVSFSISSLFEIVIVKFLEVLLNYKGGAISIFNLLSFDSIIHLIYLFAGVIAFKFILELLLQYWINKFSYLFQFFIKKKLIAKYINLAEDQVATEKKINVILVEVKNLTHMFIRPIIKIIYNSLMITMLIGYLIYVIPGYLFLYFFIFISLSLFLIYKISRIAKKSGARAGVMRELNLMFLADIFNGSFEINYFDFENRFKSKYLQSFKKQIKVELKRDFTANLFKPVVETIVIIAFLSYFLMNLMKNVQVDLAQFGVITFLVLKIIPLLQQFTSSLSNIRFYSKSLNIVYQEVVSSFKMREVETGKLAENIVFSIQNLNFNFDDKSVFRDFSHEFIRGKTYYLKGASGRGKSTLMNLLTGKYSSNSGEIILNDHFTSEDIVYLRQTPHIFDLTLEENIGMFNNIDSNTTHLSSILNLVNLEELHLDASVGTKGTQISGGQRQKINLARLALHPRAIVIIDEAFNSIDKKSRDKIIQNIKNLNPELLIFTSHDEDLSKFADEIIELH